MCRTIHALLTVVICGVQMLVRVFMTLILMIENVIRMFLQTLYNFISFLLQLISLIPICCVFFATSRLKCFMCGGGGPCPVRRGGGCDCLMSAVAIIILFFIFRATGVLDKIFYSIGYAKAAKHVVKYSPTPGTITECSRNDSFVTNATTPQLTSSTTEEASEISSETTPFGDSEIGDDTKTMTEVVYDDVTSEFTEITNEMGPVSPAAANTDKGGKAISDTSVDAINPTTDTTQPTRTTAKPTPDTTKPSTDTTNPATNTTISTISIDESTTITAEPTTTEPIKDSPNADISETSSVEPVTESNSQTLDNRRIGDDDDQIYEDTQRNTNTKTDEDTIVLYYEEDTQISANKSTGNDESREMEIEEEDVTSPENENKQYHVSKLRIRGTVSRSSYDKNGEKSQLKGWLGTTSVIYYMV